MSEHTYLSFRKFKHWTLPTQLLIKITKFNLLAGSLYI